MNWSLGTRCNTFTVSRVWEQDVRFSPHFYNTEQEIAKAFALIAAAG
jgi:selenocysteine lyase/cysteine desulfurase